MLARPAIKAGRKHNALLYLIWISSRQPPIPGVKLPPSGLPTPADGLRLRTTPSGLPEDFGVRLRRPLREAGRSAPPKSSTRETPYLSQARRFKERGFRFIIVVRFIRLQYKEPTSRKRKETASSQRGENGLPGKLVRIHSLFH